MKKSTKGALAAGTAAALLLGGAGTLAYWTADGEVDAGTLASGNIALSSITCDADWKYNDAEGSGTVTKIVPGDIVEKKCTASLTGEGDHLKATIAVDEDSYENLEIGTEGEELEVGVELTSAAGPVPVSSTATPVAFTITVEFPYGGPVSAPDPETDAKNSSQSKTTDALDAIRVVAVQVHD